jgi:hypothetical protein
LLSIWSRAATIWHCARRHCRPHPVVDRRLRRVWQIPEFQDYLHLRAGEESGFPSVGVCETDEIIAERDRRNTRYGAGVKGGAIGEKEGPDKPPAFTAVFLDPKCLNIRGLQEVEELLDEFTGHDVLLSGVSWVGTDYHDDRQAGRANN